MPVTIKPAGHQAQRFDPRPTRRPLELNGKASNGLEALKKTDWSSTGKCKEFYQSSFQCLDSDDEVYPYHNGFVGSCILAYSKHNHLIIRPEDVWFAIISQFSIYVNNHAEELRKQFVAHEGKRDLVIVYHIENRYAMDYGKFATDMAELLEKCVVDPELREWIVPDFSTSEDTDKIVGSILMMASMQQYFTMKCRLGCGLPSVRLLGTKQDWENIAQRIEKLIMYGEECTEFCSLLKPVLSRFVQSFDAPDSEETRDFWQHIATKQGGGSGPTFVAGWITAFCFWHTDGRRLDSCHSGCELDDVTYHSVNLEMLPSAIATVPVTVDDWGTLYSTTMVAGSVGFQVSSTGQRLDGEREGEPSDTMSRLISILCSQ